MVIVAEAFAGEESLGTIISEWVWDELSFGGREGWWWWCVGGGGVDGFECMMTSRTGGVAVASALVGMLGATRMFRWCTPCGGGIGRSSNGGLSWWSEGCALEPPTGGRLGCPKLVWGGTISPGAEAPTGVYCGAVTGIGVCTTGGG